ncbi:MAG: hypothetical protein U1E65_13885 [Myxococcota bacterium]
MHTGRQLSHRLIPLLAAAALGSGCASARYVGSISPSGMYANLGYGFAVELSHEGLMSRWAAIDPAKLEEAPAGSRPEVVDAPLDTDGNGVLEGAEMSHFLRPTLRLLALTSSTSSAASAKISMDVDAVILGGVEADDPLQKIAASAVRELVGGEPPQFEDRRVGPDFPAFVGEGHTADGGEYKIAIVDHARFAGEYDIVRRQSLRILLRAPKITTELRRDFIWLLEAITLSHQAGPLSRQETR